MPSHWSDLGWEFLWARAGLPFWAISFGAYSLALGYCLWRVSRDARSRWRHAALPLAFLCLPLTLLNLAAAYDKDPTSRSQSAALHEALEVVTAQSHADDLLLLSSQDYVEFVMNHLDSAQPRPIVLERPRAQAASDRQPARVVSSNPDDWFDVMSVRTILHLTRRHERIWLLAETSPWMTWELPPDGTVSGAALLPTARGRARTQRPDWFVCWNTAHAQPPRRPTCPSPAMWRPICATASISA